MLIHFPQPVMSNGHAAPSPSFPSVMSFTTSQNECMAEHSQVPLNEQETI